MAIDATVSFGYEQDFQRPVYPIQRVSLEKFFSAADIAKGKSLMRGWAEVVARNGR
jgi:4-hydroxy-3-polyprenylbenzoate decarboxylase